MPSFSERHGLRGLLVGGSPFLAGLAGILGLDFRRAPDLATALNEAAAALGAGRDFVWCHTKELDEAGHTKDPHERVRVLDRLDTALGRLDDDPFCAAVVAVTGDHATPAVDGVIHSGDPVPLLVAGPGVRADRTHRFGEIDCAGGVLGHLRGEDLMPVLLNAADRPHFLGSRPTVVAGPAGFPRHVEPLDV